jgi:AraC family transcriptional regulator of arabinose operon
MAARKKTPWSPHEGPVAGEFWSDAVYTNWRPHGTDDWLLIYTVGGAGYMTTAAAKGPTRPGDVTLYAPGEVHDYRTDPGAKRWHLLWVHFLPRPAWYPWLRWPTGSHGVKSLHLESGEVRDHFAAAMRRMVRISQRRLADTHEFALNALEEALLWARVAVTRTRLDTRVRRAMDYLAADLRQSFCMETVARHCGVSPSRLAHLFKAEAGISAQQFFEKQRMGHASQLLRMTGLGIAEIAAEVGYDDPFYFSNRFRRFAGKSPSEFRGRKTA